MEKEQVAEKLNLIVWKHFWGILKPYRKDFLTLFFIMVLTAAFDTLFPLMTKYSIDNFIIKKTIQGLGSFAIIYFLAACIFSIIIYSFISKAGRLETKMAYDIRNIAFKKLQLLSLSYYDERPAGWILSRMTSDIQRLSETISWGLVDLSWGLFVMIGISTTMIILNFKLALIVLTVIPFVGLASIYFQKKILKAQRIVRDKNSQITSAFNEDIQGAKTTKSLAREDINLEEFKIISRGMKESSIRAVILSSLYLPIVLTLGSIGIGLAITYGGDFLIRDLISFGTLALFITYAAQLFEPIRQLAVIFTELQAAQASAERVFSLINEIPEIEDRLDVVEKYGDIFYPKKNTWPEIHGNISFKNVSFSYKNGEEVLKDFNLEVKAGQTIALVGETGAGKSTIVNLFCRFYEPTSGEIFIDRINYKNMPQNWIHDNLGYVLQSPHLFSGSIKDNIRYGNLQASESDIVDVCKMLKIHDFIMNLEDGYNTEIGEGGSLISTGQKQLISFARAVIRKPRLFVLDEATSSIDTETERTIQEAIRTVLEGRTSFIIAHRLSTIRNADKILVIDGGKIKESGSHSDLIKKKGYYYNLYKNQFIEEESKIILG